MDHNLCVVQSTNHGVHGRVFPMERGRRGRMVTDQIVVVIERKPFRHLDQVASHRVQALADQDQDDQAEEPVWNNVKVGLTEGKR